MTLLSCLNGHAAKRVLHVNYIEGQDEITNPLKEKFAAALKGTNFEIIFQPTPAIRSIKMLETGTVDVELARIALWNGSIGKNYIRVKNPIGIFTSGFYYTNPKFKNAANINKKNLKLGVVHGSKMAESPSKEFKNVIRVRDPETLKKMLLSNRIDIFIDKHQDGLLEDSKLKIYFAPIERHAVYTFVNKDFSEIVPLLEHAFETN